MKKLFLVLLIAVPIFTLNALAGNDSGGGSQIEAGFKTKALDLANQFIAFSPAAQNALSFKPFTMKTILIMPGMFRPHCATMDDVLPKMRAMGKQALVVASEPTVINLDCGSPITDADVQAWKNRFASYSEADMVFFTHEILRTMQVENEDDYSNSATVLAAQQIEDVAAKNAVAKLFNNSGPNCKLDVKDVASVTLLTMTNPSGLVVLNTYLFGDSYRIGRFGTVTKSIVITNLINAPGDCDMSLSRCDDLSPYDPRRINRFSLYKAAREFGCAQ
jgi:hypothetical protein